MKNKKLSFRIMMISVFALLSFFVVCIVLIIQYNFNQNITQKIANDQFKILSKDINKDVYQLNKTYENFIEIYTSFLKNGNIQDILENKIQLIKIYTDFLKKNKNIYALYVGTSEDIFFNIRGVDKDKVGTKSDKKNMSGAWLVREVRDGVETRAFYDKNLNLISSKTMKANFQATQRPWYKKAIKSHGQPIRTDPYKFDLFSEFGITYSKEYDNGKVFSMDILLEDLNEMLQKRLILKSQNSCIVDKNLNIIAKTKFLDISICKKIFQERQNDFLKDINGTKYIYKVCNFGDDFLISYANFDTLMSPYQKELKKNIIFAAVIVLILSFLVWILASTIIKPIVALSKENEKIAQRDFGHIKEVESCVFEISQLSKSIVNMSRSIKKHHEELKYLSITDTLTKIYNRAKLESVLHVKLDEFRRYGHKFGIIMIDIDGFKEVNDHFGHQVGDKFLVEFVNNLKMSMRSSDIIGRWGGEEFVVICKETDSKSLEKLAYNLKNNIELHTFETVIKKTASFGVAQYKKGESIDELIGRADKALYRAKDGGRNQVMVG